MDTQPDQPASLSAIPGFAPPPSQTRVDPASPDQTTQPAPETPGPTMPGTAALLGRLRGRSTSGEASSAATDTSTDGPTVKPARRWKPGGDPQEVGEILSGLIMIISGFIAMAAVRRSRKFRAPTPEQRDAIAFPLGAIATRHLPMQVFGKDFSDATKSARAVHDYVADGRLFTRSDAPALDLPERSA